MPHCANGSSKSQPSNPWTGPVCPWRRRAILSGEVPASGPSRHSTRGLAGAALEERLGTEAMAGFDGEAHDRIVDRFVGASDALRGTLRGILPSRVVRSGPVQAGSDVRDRGSALEREVGRTRGGLSVRRLVQTYGEVVGELTPCVLVSPDSLARFIPPGSIGFDLVIVRRGLADHGAGCDRRSRTGAGCRHRGRLQADAAIEFRGGRLGRLCGVRRDLPVASVAPVTAVAADPSAADGGEPEATAADFGSCPTRSRSSRRWSTQASTGCGCRGTTAARTSRSSRSRTVTTTTTISALSQHIPGEVTDTGLSFTRVDGTFYRTSSRAQPGRPRRRVARRPLRTNPVEAAAVVEGGVRRRWGQGRRSIGVVTFNLQQRTSPHRGNLLWDLGDETIADSLASGKDGLFVKNLENVQGDERDVIIFSTGFARWIRCPTAQLRAA